MMSHRSVRVFVVKVVELELDCQSTRTPNSAVTCQLWSLELRPWRHLANEFRVYEVIKAVNMHQSKQTVIVRMNRRTIDFIVNESASLITHARRTANIIFEMQGNKRYGLLCASR